MQHLSIPGETQDRSVGGFFTGIYGKSCTDDDECQTKCWKPGDIYTQILQTYSFDSKKFQTTTTNYIQAKGGNFSFIFHLDQENNVLAN